MAPDDDDPGRPAPGYIYDGDGATPVGDEPQAAHWQTLELSLPGEAVRERIRRALATVLVDWLKRVLMRGGP